MSLILDALRRADAERERGAVPGLHAQPAPLPKAPAGPSARWSWALAAAGGAALLGAAAFWLAAGRGIPEAARSSGPRAAATVPAPAPPNAVVSGPTSVLPVPPAPPAALASPATAPAAPAAALTAPAAAAPAPAALARPQPVAEPAPWPSAAAAKRPAAAPGDAAPSAAEPPIVARDRLPDEIRAQLPPLAIGGSIYSPRPADRSLIIDGRIYRENDRLGADLTLERIGVSSAVLRFQGYRFEIGF